MHWVGINFVESQFERGEGGSVARQSGGEVGTEQTKNTAGGETGVGNPVALGVWQALDDAVEAQAAERVSEGTLSKGFGSATAEFGEMVEQVGSAKTVEGGRASGHATGRGRADRRAQTAGKAAGRSIGPELTALQSLLCHILGLEPEWDPTAPDAVRQHE